MDFLRVIVVDSFSLAPSPKQAPVIDILLEVSFLPLDYIVIISYISFF